VRVSAVAADGASLVSGAGLRATRESRRSCHR
jgi:hypothetical protein